MMTIEDNISLLILLVYALLTRIQHLLPPGNEKITSPLIFFLSKKDFQA